MLTEVLADKDSFGVEDHLDTCKVHSYTVIVMAGVVVLLYFTSVHVIVYI